jgi:hypothetical protein
MTTSQTRLCDYCHEPALGLTSRLDHLDPRSPLGAIDHPSCYNRLLEDQLLRMNAGTAEALR